MSIVVDTQLETEGKVGF